MSESVCANLCKRLGSEFNRLRNYFLSLSGEDDFIYFPQKSTFAYEL